MTIDFVTVGEARGVLEIERIDPLSLGGPMRLSMAGAETTVVIGVACQGDWEGLPTRTEVELLRGGDVHR